jgi:hypothetical protein
VLENLILRRIFGLTAKEIIGSQRKVHENVAHNLCTSPDIISMLKSKRMRWEGSAGRKEKM